MHAHTDDSQDCEHLPAEHIIFLQKAKSLSVLNCISSAERLAYFNKLTQCETYFELTQLGKTDSHTIIFHASDYSVNNESFQFVLTTRNIQHLANYHCQIIAIV